MFCLVHALPLCGAALTFFAAAKKVSKESGLTPPALDHRLRAPNRSSASHGVLPFTARCQRLEWAPHPPQLPVAQPAAANGYSRPGGKLCVGRGTPRLSAPTTPTLLSSHDLGFQSGVMRVRRDSRHTVCRYRTWAN
jgi:hypothetical protein